MVLVLANPELEVWDELGSILGDWTSQLHNIAGQSDGRQTEQLNYTRVNVVPAST
jgi:hypothetical protein